MRSAFFSAMGRLLQIGRVLFCTECVASSIIAVEKRHPTKTTDSSAQQNYLDRNYVQEVKKISHSHPQVCRSFPTPIYRNYGVKSEKWQEKKRLCAALISVLFGISAIISHRRQSASSHLEERKNNNRIGLNEALRIDGKIAEIKQSTVYVYY